MWSTFFFNSKKQKLQSLTPSHLHTFFLITCLYTCNGSSAGKESTCNAGDPRSAPGSERSPGEGIGHPLQYSWASLGGSDSKESTCNVVDLGSIPGLGRSPGGGHGNPLSILAWRIPTDRGAWWAMVHGITKSQARLNN